MTRARVLAAIAAVTMMATLGLVSSASAAVTPPGHGSNEFAEVSASSARPPLVAEQAAGKTCPMVKSRFRVYNKNCGLIGQAHLCFTGNHGNFSSAPRYASNGCGSRVWIYPGKDEEGPGLCLSRRTFTGYLKKEYLSFRVVRNKGSC